MCNIQKFWRLSVILHVGCVLCVSIGCKDACWLPNTTMHNIPFTRDRLSRFRAIQSGDNLFAFVHLFICVHSSNTYIWEGLGNSKRYMKLLYAVCLGALTDFYIYGREDWWWWYFLPADTWPAAFVGATLWAFQIWYDSIGWCVVIKLSLCTFGGDALVFKYVCFVLFWRKFNLRENFSSYAVLLKCGL